MVIKTFIKNFKNYSIGQFFLQGFGILTVPIFTRLLSVSEYGMVNIFVYNLNVFTVIYSFSIGQSVVRYYYERKMIFNSFYQPHCWFNLLGLFYYQ